jgi:hypothetical protein
VLTGMVMSMFTIVFMSSCYLCAGSSGNISCWMNLEAVEFIERHKDRPFFLYLSHYALHTILHGKKKLAENIGKSLDDRKGMIVRKLTEFYEIGQIELYNIAEDISEKSNLKNVRTEKVNELLTLL